MEDCIFCKIIEKKMPANIVYEDEKYISFLTLEPINPGHLLIVPKDHSSYVFDIEEPIYSELFVLSKKIAKALKDVTDAKRIGLAIEGFGVDHTHIHLVPVNSGNELDPNRGKPAAESELEDMANEIIEALKKQ